MVVRFAAEALHPGCGMHPDAAAHSMRARVLRSVQALGVMVTVEHLEDRLGHGLGGG
ncbi:hypothetical protein ABH927_005863 [Planotetraspora sp. GP83]